MAFSKAPKFFLDMSVSSWSMLTTLLCWAKT